MNVQARIPAEIYPDDADQRSSPPRLGDAVNALTLTDMLQVIRVRSRTFFVAAGLFFSVTMLVALLLPPYYTGTAYVMLDQRQNNTVNTTPVVGDLPNDQTAVLDQVQILKSLQLASRVVDKLHLDQDPEFQGHSGSFLHYINPMSYLRAFLGTNGEDAEVARQRDREAVLQNFEDDLTAAQVQLSTAIRVDFTAKDPVKAARIANAIADAYVEDQLNAKLEATQRATQWISGRLGKLAQESRVAETALEQYKIQNHITDVTASTGTGTVSVLDTQIGAATSQLMQAQMDRAQAEATLSRVRSLVNSGHAADVSSVVNSPLITQLRGQEAELVQKQAEMASRYGPEHPKMLDLLAEKRDLDIKINQEIQHVVASASNDVAVASARAAALQSSLHNFEGQSGVQGAARVKERELEATASSSRALYDSFVQRVKQTEQEQTLQIPDARIISRSTIPDAASFPPLKIVFISSILLALLFGLLVVYGLERLDHGFRTTARVESLLGLPVLATLPDTLSAVRSKYQEKGGNKKAADQIIDKPLSSFSESVRGLHLGLTLSDVDKPVRSVVVTSALPEEGKTTISLSLARHVAQMGRRTILIDGDLRRPNVKTATGCTAPEFDLIDVLRGRCMLENALVRDSRTSLEILPVIKHVSNAPDLLESHAMERLISQLEERYDLVVIDSAPVLPVNDTKVLTRLVDTVVFVVRWERTPRRASIDAVRALRDVHAPIAGAVLSRADTKRFHYYSFGYGGYYSAYSRYYAT